MDDLLVMLKRSVGDLNESTELDDYYINYLEQARADLISDDISDTVIDSDMGKLTIVAYAKLLINDQDIATNQTIALLRNKLADMTKGERSSNDYR